MSGWNTEGTKGRCLIRMNQMTYLDIRMKHARYSDKQNRVGHLEKDPLRYLLSVLFSCP